MPEYFLILLGLFLVTLYLHWYFKIKIFKSFGQLLIFNGTNLFLATVWDQYAIFRGHWSFNETFLLGPKIGYMPIEEFLFVLVLSFFALTFYKILDSGKLRKRPEQ